MEEKRNNSAVIRVQPGSQSFPMETSVDPLRKWLPMPMEMPGCPPGLEYFAGVDELLVHQQVEPLEAFTVFETKNKYAIKNLLGQQAYFAAEDTEYWNRQCCESSRPFEMQIFDSMQREVLHLHRPFACWQQEIEVSGPPGSLLGIVKQEWSCGPKFRVENASGQTLFRIQGQCCPITCCGDIEFQILTADGLTQVGMISNHWAGFAKESFTDADNFGIRFPPNIGVNMKATLLGALFLIDYVYFQKDNKHRRNGGRGGAYR